MAATQRASDSSTSPRFSAPRLPSISIPNPDIFSDDYALEPLHDSANSSPVSPVESDDETAPVNVFSTPRASVDIDPSRSNASTRSHRPISTLKRPREGQNGIPNRVVSMLSQAESGTHRTSSSSSRMSIPRSQSPYVGASGPSHPYGMYPQVTRTSSIASGSTVRPEERGFITPTGPEHPYSMYPQTTLPEDDVATQPLSIPLGFPGMGQQYHQRTRRADNDVADLVGADGHVEQLPPYTRYPEGIAPKEPPTHIDMPVIGATVDRNVDAMSPQSATTQHDDGQAVWNVAAARTASSESDGSLKERWKEKGRRRVLCGLPLWLVLVLLAVMLLIGAIGGVIGGVVGRKKDSSSQPAPLPDSTSPTAAVTVTETSWIDASPLPTTTGTPNIPIGTWNIPTTNTNLSSNSCVQNPSQAFTWGCMPPGGIGVDIVPWGPFYQIQFDTYPLNGTVQYGTQPPDLGTGLNDLLPYMDKVASNLGPSLFFYTLYDKLTVGKWSYSCRDMKSMLTCSQQFLSGRCPSPASEVYLFETLKAETTATVATLSQGTNPGSAGSTKLPSSSSSTSMTTRHRLTRLLQCPHRGLSRTHT